MLGELNAERRPFREEGLQGFDADGRYELLLYGAEEEQGFFCSGSTGPSKPCNRSTWRTVSPGSSNSDGSSRVMPPRPYGRSPFLTASKIRSVLSRSIGHFGKSSESGTPLSPNASNPRFGTCQSAPADSCFDRTIKDFGIVMAISLAHFRFRPSSVLHQVSSPGAGSGIWDPIDGRAVIGVDIDGWRRHEDDVPCHVFAGSGFLPVPSFNEKRQDQSPVATGVGIGKMEYCFALRLGKDAKDQSRSE
ncbi:hypothetical protein RLIN73S_00162 [Rhodanobacter lindaniclasticus]